MTSIERDEAYRRIWGRFKNAPWFDLDHTDRAVLVACYGPFYKEAKRFAHSSYGRWQYLRLLRGTTLMLRARMMLFDACDEVQRMRWFDNKSLCKPTLFAPASYKICGRSMVCPCCWARKIVIPTFHRLEGLLTNGLYHGYALRGQQQYAVLETRSEYSDQQHVDGRNHTSLLLQALAARAKEQRAHGLPAGCLGGATVCSAVPAETGWTCSYSSLLVYPAHAAGTPLRSADSFRWLAPPISVPELISAVGAVCSFPRELLVQGSTAGYERVQQLLAVRSRFRLLATFGVLRGRTDSPWIEQRIDDAPASSSRGGRGRGRRDRSRAGRRSPAHASASEVALSPAGLSGAVCEDE